MTMNVQTFSETHGITPFEVFGEAWKYVFSRPCASNRVALDHYIYHHTTPNYVDSYLRAFQDAHQN